MHVLILSCSTGGGHNAAGAAMKEALEAAGHQAVLLHYMDLAGKKVADTVDNTYLKMVKRSPKMFGALYKAGIFISSSRRRSPVYYANAAMGKYLKAYLEEHPVDYVVMTHLYAAETLTYLKKQMKLPPNLVIATDYTCIPFWEETACEAYMLPHKDLVEEYVLRGMDREILHPMGIPVSGKFLEASEKRESKEERNKIKEELGLAKDKRILLMMGGSMGFGRLAGLARLVRGQMKENEFLAVICGSNQKMEELLKKEYASDGRVSIIGKTSRVADYMAVSDLVYTKPGGLTSTEAAAARCPLVHTDPIPGCETKNRQFFLERGMCLTGETLEEQAEAGRRLLDDAKLAYAMQQAQAEHVDARAARQIVAWMEERIRE